LEVNDTYGVRGMRERAKMVNGAFSIESAPGEGTRLSFSLEVNHG
jgi:signal transduction histidine kinase